MRGILTLLSLGLTISTQVFGLPIEERLARDDMPMLTKRDIQGRRKCQTNPSLYSANEPVANQLPFGTEASRGPYNYAPVTTTEPMLQPLGSNREQDRSGTTLLSTGRSDDSVEMASVTGSTESSVFPKEIVKVLLQGHNRLRSEVGKEYNVALAPLQWDESLAKEALAWSQQMAFTLRKMEHATDRNGAGENLFYGAKGIYPTNTLEKYEQATYEKWGMSEKVIYEREGSPAIGQGGSFTEWGHYTQMVWRDTTRVGCGEAINGDEWYLTCRYKTSGNLSGKKPF